MKRNQEIYGDLWAFSVDDDFISYSELAREFAIRWHKGKKDIAGMPYIDHLSNVAEKCMRASFFHKAIGWLHDILEDTDCTEHILRKNFPDSIVDVVIILTKIKDESYDEYIIRVSENKDASFVKIIDLRHNMDITRLNKLRFMDLIRLQKYHKGLKFLEGNGK
jgi:(p)ppGpp synthase/HD superfamily hydrolase